MPSREKYPHFLLFGRLHFIYGGDCSIFSSKNILMWTFLEAKLHVGMENRRKKGMKKDGHPIFLSENREESDQRDASRPFLWEKRSTTRLKIWPMQYFWCMGLIFKCVALCFSQRYGQLTSLLSLSWLENMTHAIFLVHVCHFEMCGTPFLAFIIHCGCLFHAKVMEIGLWPLGPLHWMKKYPW